MKENTKRFIAALLATTTIFTVSACSSKKEDTMDEEKTINSELKKNAKEEVENFISIKDNLDELIDLENSLYDYKQYLYCRKSEVYRDDVREISNSYKLENELLDLPEQKLTYFGYREDTDPNGNKLMVKDKEGNSIEELISEGYNYIRANDIYEYCDQELIISHMFYGYRIETLPTGEKAIYRSEPTPSIEELIDKGYTYVKQGEIYYGYDTITGKFIEFQDTMGTEKVKTQELTLKKSSSN